MNLCIFIGNLTHDPEVKTVNGRNGPTSVVNFSIGVNTRWKDKEGNLMEDVVFPEIQAWNGQADLIGKHFRKGDLIRVFTRLKDASYEDKQTGERRRRSRYALDRFEFPESGRRKDENTENTENADADDVDDFEDAATKEVEPKPAQPKRGRGRPPKVAVTATTDDEDGDDNIPF